jgi:hypothetical protein
MTYFEIKHTREYFEELYAADCGLNRVEVDALLAKLDYFNAPASHNHHLCTSGGLALHSGGVVYRALELAGDIPYLSRWRIIAAGLFHDIGKCGLYHDGVLQPRYIRKPWGAYSVSDTAPHFSVRDLSAMYAVKMGLPWDVVQAILIHDGLYHQANEDYFIGRKPLNLALLLETADNLQAQVFEGRELAYKVLPGNGGAVPPRRGGDGPGKARKAEKAPGRA